MANLFQQNFLYVVKNLRVNVPVKINRLTEIFYSLQTKQVRSCKNSCLEREKKACIKKKYCKISSQACLFLRHFFYYMFSAIFNTMWCFYVLPPTIFLHGAALHFHYGTISSNNRLEYYFNLYSDVIFYREIIDTHLDAFLLHRKTW